MKKTAWPGAFLPPTLPAAPFSKGVNGSTTGVLSHPFPLVSATGVWSCSCEENCLAGSLPASHCWPCPSYLGAVHGRTFRPLELRSETSASCDALSSEFWWAVKITRPPEGSCLHTLSFGLDELAFSEPPKLTNCMRSIVACVRGLYSLSRHNRRVRSWGTIKDPQGAADEEASHCV